MKRVRRRPARPPRRAVGFALAGLLVAGALVAGRFPGLGDRVGSVEVEEVLAGPEAGDLLQQLDGEALVIEFFATWCGPCRDNVPHWNRMVEDLTGEPVRFVTVTSQSAGKIRRYLRKQPVSGWVAIDRDGSVFDTFRVRSLPVTVLVDRRGRVWGRAHPARVDSDLIRRMLEGGDAPGPIAAAAETAAHW